MFFFWPRGCWIMSSLHWSLLGILGSFQYTGAYPACHHYLSLLFHICALIFCSELCSLIFFSGNNPSTRFWVQTQKTHFLLLFVLRFDSKYLCLSIQHSSRHLSQVWIFRPQNNLKTHLVLIHLQKHKDNFIWITRLETLPRFTDIWHKVLDSMTPLTDILVFFNPNLSSVYHKL